MLNSVVKKLIPNNTQKQHHHHRTLIQISGAGTTCSLLALLKNDIQYKYTRRIEVRQAGNHEE
jgi:hypothetical protein